MAVAEMAQQKAKNKHSEALDLIGYGLAKFAGPMRLLRTSLVAVMPFSEDLLRLE